MRAVALLVGILLLPTIPGWAAPQLGSYEKQALDLALARTGLELEPSPEGKILGRIHVVNLDVFSPRDGFLQFFNLFHITTGENIVRREVLLEPGRVWDQALIDETERKLRDPIFSSLAVLAPVRPTSGSNAENGTGAGNVGPGARVPAGRVDLLVVTRDVWSLRLNSDFEFQQDTLSYLLIAPSENNFLGLRKLAAGLFEMGLGDFRVGGAYIDKNVLGKKLDLTARADAIFKRCLVEDEGESCTNDFEGESLRIIFERPFWSLASRWAAGIDILHQTRVVRLFQDTDAGIGLRQVPEPEPDTPAICDGRTAGFEYHQRFQRVDTAASHQVGQRIKHRFSAGHRLRILRPELLSDFPDDPCLRQHFQEQVLPPSERSSELFVRYRLFDTQFAKLRNVNTFDLAEDFRFGPLLAAELSAALEPLGSENTFATASLGGSWTLPWSPGGFAGLGFEIEGRLQDGKFRDNEIEGIAQVVSPFIGGVARVVARSTIEVLVRDQQNNFYVLGGENGLRGYPIGALAGEARVLANIDVRTAPIEFGFMRAGALVFADVGDAPDSLDQFTPRGNIGVGLRLLLPQLSTLVYRLDWAVALEGPTAGFPGRIIFGAGQAFGDRN